MKKVGIPLVSRNRKEAKMEYKTPVKTLCEMLQCIEQTKLNETHTDEEINAFYGLIGNIREVLAIVKSEGPADDKAKVECVINGEYDKPAYEYDKQTRAILQSLNCFAQQ